MKTVREIIEIDESLCDGCGKCLPSCQEGAIQIVGGKARLVSDKFCDGFGACLGECPTGALKVVRRTAEAFDEDAVKAQPSRSAVPEGDTAAPSGCPGAQVRRFAPGTARPAAPVTDAPSNSALSHWPVQIRLVPASAPFLVGADVLIVADCVPIAYAGFHQDLLAGRVVLVGCPKFDDAPLYIERLTEIFRTAALKSVTVAVMEVPCCQQMPPLVAHAMKLARVDVPTKTVVISLDGHVLAQ